MKIIHNAIDGNEWNACNKIIAASCAIRFLLLDKKINVDSINKMLNKIDSLFKNAETFKDLVYIDFAVLKTHFNLLMRIIDKRENENIPGLRSIGETFDRYLVELENLSMRSAFIESTFDITTMRGYNIEEQLQETGEFEALDTDIVHQYDVNRAPTAGKQENPSSKPKTEIQENDFDRFFN